MHYRQVSFLMLTALALAITACSTIGENQRLVLIPKRDLFNLYDFLTVREATRACYTRETVEKVLNQYCDSKVKISADFSYRKKPPSQKECYKNNSIAGRDGIEFRGEIVKDGYDISNALGITGDKLQWTDIQKHLGSAIVDRCRNKLDNAQVDLAHTYWSQLPFVVSDAYDTRSSRFRRINIGDPVSIIINKVYIAQTLERHLSKFDGQEIAVVISVIDGGEAGQKDTLVAYEEKLTNHNSRLPIGDLLAYTTESYKGQPIRITISVFDLDEVKIDWIKPLLTQVADMAKLTGPMTSTLLSASQTLGSFLVNSKSEDIAIKFTFQLYPWSTDPSVTANMGEPKIAEATYVVFNENVKSANLPKDLRTIQVGYGLVPYTVTARTGEPPYQPQSSGSKADNASVAKQESCSPRPPYFRLHCSWPAHDTSDDQVEITKNSYAFLSVTKTSMISAQSIIDQAEKTLRQVSGLGTQGTNVAPDNIKGAKNALKSMADALDLFQNQQRFLQRMATEKDKGVVVASFIEETRQQISQNKSDELNTAYVQKTVGLINSYLPADGDAGDCTQFTIKSIMKGNNCVTKLKNSQYDFSEIDRRLVAK